VGLRQGHLGTDGRKGRKQISQPNAPLNGSSLYPATLSPEDKLRAAEDFRWAAWRLKAAWLREIHQDWPDLRVEETVRGIFLNA
jgi:hypothetical protein